MKLKETQKDFAFLHSLPGQKIIAKGNHDLWWETMKKMNGFLEQNEFSRLHFLFNNAYDVGSYALCGSRGWFFEEDGEDQKVLLREVGRLRMSLEEGKKIGKEPIVFLHYPPIYQDTRCKEILEVLKEYGVRRCYYGHLHGPSICSAVNGEVDGITYRLVSGDSLEFCPHLIEKF
jgi:predicted phosphohydrolase